MESTNKKIYVGDTDYLRALSLNNLSVPELNDQVAAGATIEPNGTIVSPTPSPTSNNTQSLAPIATTAPLVNPTSEETDVAQAPISETKSGTSTIVPIAVVVAIAISGSVFFAVSKKKKDTDE